MERPNLLPLQLEARGLEGLLPLLEAAEGAVVGELFKIEHVAAVGRQSVVFFGRNTETGDPVAIKQPAFDYRRPAAQTQRGARVARRTLAREHKVLREAPGDYFPKTYGLLTQEAVVPAATQCAALTDTETFLVQEWIDGGTVRELSHGPWRDDVPLVMEQRAAAIARDFIQFWEGLAERGWFYSDVSAGNLMIQRNPERLRVVDGGCVTPRNDDVKIVGQTPAFATPTITEAMKTGVHLPFSLALVLPPLGKLLFYMLTRSEPVPGKLPDLKNAPNWPYSRHCRHTISAMLQLDSLPQNLIAARSALASWVSAIDRALIEPESEES